MIIDNFKDFFKKQLKDVLATKLTESVELQLNNLINDMKTFTALYDSNHDMTGINVNYTLVEKPIFNK